MLLLLLQLRCLERDLNLLVEGVHDGGGDFVSLRRIFDLVEVESDGSQNLLESLLVNVGLLGREGEAG